MESSGVRYTIARVYYLGQRIQCRNDLLAGDKIQDGEDSAMKSEMRCEEGDI